MAAVAALCMEALVSARGAVEREVGALGCCATVSRADGAPSCARTVLSAGRVQSWPVIGLRIHMGKMTTFYNNEGNRHGIHQHSCVGQGVESGDELGGGMG